MAKIEIIRHSLSHIMASVIKELYPKTKFAMGPAIENGFYYDIEIKNFKEDFSIIEEKMKEKIKENLSFKKEIISKIKAKKIFADQPYKLEIIKEIKEKNVSIYSVGKFTDLCSGPHVKNTKEINIDSFKLTKIAGAYFKGDEKNKMLTRIYGLAFNTKEELDNYLKMQEEAERRDHRKIGRELDLFHIDEIVGLGLPLWHPKGALLWRIIEDFWYREHLKNGYQLLRTPHIGNKRLWETSGHWGFYNDSMYPPIEVGQTLKENQDKEKVKDSEQFLLKPMNCPFHIQIFKNKIHSYREFPLRWAECGTVYRFEKKGELSGLTRVRGFTQDDAHIICRSDQVEEELEKVVDFILFIYKSFGFNIENVNVYLSVRDPKSKKYAGNDKGWKFTEKILEKVAKNKNLKITKDIGGAVFYGPKLDFKVNDAIGREWQCSTLQFDFNLPERFDMSFVNENGKNERPYMLHRALFGSFERFIGILIEHYAGSFPLWLSPIQIKIITVNDSCFNYASNVKSILLKENIRVEIDSENNTVSKKIRDAELQKIPYIIVIGEKEIKENNISVREKKSRNQEIMDINKFVEKIKKEIEELK